jgi:hypothetical protein
MSQGLQVAPHQSLIAHALSATVLMNGIEILASSAREAASHLKRLGAIYVYMVGTQI